MRLSNPLRVRASLHTSSAELESGDYYRSAVNRAARLRAIAHGGQAIFSDSAFGLIQDRIPPEVTIADMGPHRLKDLIRSEHVYQRNVEDLETSSGPHAEELNSPSSFSGPSEHQHPVASRSTRHVSAMRSDESLLTGLRKDSLGRV